MKSFRELERSPEFKRWVVVGLRIALGLVFFWFGMLKVLGYNPVFDIVNASFPMLATDTGNVALGLLETAIGIGLLFRLFPHALHTVLFLHMMGTLSVFLTAPELMFSPSFPILTLAGEFVFKNIVLAISGLVVLFHEQ
jgi:putative oxidoreductase